MNDVEKIILGVDPGTNILGYAFLQILKKEKPRIITMGVLDLRKHNDHGKKLSFIFEELQQLISIYKPTEAAIEAPFYGNNVQSMLKLGRAQGAAMLAIAHKDIMVSEYSPKSVKKSVTGNGNASKEQVARMFPNIVSGEINDKINDATDALGVAYCHYINSKGLKKGEKKHKNWSSFLNENPNRQAKL